MNRPEKEHREVGEDTARIVLAPIYGEAEYPGEREAAELEALRELLHDYMSGSGDDVPGEQERLREAVVSAVETPERFHAQLEPIEGLVWMRRRGAEAAFPVAEAESCGAGCELTTGEDAHARLLIGQGVVVALRGSSELKVWKVCPSMATLELAAGALYTRSTGEDAAELNVETPQGVLRTAAGSICMVAVESDATVRVVVAEGNVDFIRTAGGKQRLGERRQAVYGADGSASVRAMSSDRVAVELGWAVPTVRRRGRFAEFVSAVCLSLFFTGIAVTRIAEAATPLPILPVPEVTSPDGGGYTTPFKMLEGNLNSPPGGGRENEETKNSSSPD